MSPSLRKTSLTHTHHADARTCLKLLHTYCQPNGDGCAPAAAQFQHPISATNHSPNVKQIAQTQPTTDMENKLTCRVGTGHGHGPYPAPVHDLAFAFGPDHVHLHVHESDASPVHVPILQYSSFKNQYMVTHLIRLLPFHFCAFPLLTNYVSGYNYLISFQFHLEFFHIFSLNFLARILEFSLY